MGKGTPIRLILRVLPNARPRIGERRVRHVHPRRALRCVQSFGLPSKHGAVLLRRTSSEEIDGLLCTKRV